MDVGYKLGYRRYILFGVLLFRVFLTFLSPARVCNLKDKHKITYSLPRDPSRRLNSSS